MNYDEQIATLYNEIQELKQWLLENTVSVNEFATYKNDLETLNKNLIRKITMLEQKIKLLEAKINNQ